MDAATLNALNEARHERRTSITITRLPDGHAETFSQEQIRDHPLGEAFAERVSRGMSGIVKDGEREFFLRVDRPSPRLVIVGAVHISQALHPIARACGFAVTIVDPRTAFATPERFADVELLAEWPLDVMDQLAFDPETAVVAVTHDPKIDDAPLTAALANGCFYVGALGSRKTHAKRRERLLEQVEETAFARINAPIGLDIGAASPAEIAVAIMAEIIAAYRNREA